MPYTLAQQNSDSIGDVFLLGDVLVTSVTYANTASSTATITHGLSAAPTWVLWQSNDNVPIMTYTANTTSITFTRTATTTSGTARVDVLAGVKA
jgi:hypothetical protein